MNKIILKISSLFIIIGCLIGISACSDDNSGNYKVIFDTHDITLGITTVYVAPGKTLSEPESPNKQGYTLDGWYTEAEELYDFSSPLEADLTLHAKWIDNATLPKLRVTLYDKKTNNSIPINSVNRADYVNGKVSITNTKGKYLLDDILTEFKGRGNGS